MVNHSLRLLIISVPLLWTSSSLFISSSNEVPELHTIFQVWLQKKCIKREHCHANLLCCVMLLQKEPEVLLALSSPLPHCFLHPGYLLIPRLPFDVEAFQILLCYFALLLTLYFGLLPWYVLQHFSNCSFIACFLSLLLISLHPFVLFFYPHLC